MSRLAAGGIATGWRLNGQVDASAALLAKGALFARLIAMTLSKNDRTGNAELALKLMMGELGEDALDHEFDITVPPYSDRIYPTSWKALEDSALISVLDVINRPFRELTGRGWLQALRVTGQIDNSELKARAGRVMKALKDSLASRNENAYVSVASIAFESKASEGFVFNFVESQFIENIFHRKGAEWQDSRKTTILVPIDFGHTA